MLWYLESILTDVIDLKMKLLDNDKTGYIFIKLLNIKWVLSADIWAYGVIMERHRDLDT